MLSVGRSLSVALLTSARTWRGSGVSLGNIAQALLDHGHRPQLCAGDAEVTAAFAARGFSASRVATGNTGLREALQLARTLRSVDADAIVVDRPRDLRLAALASLAHPLAIVNRYNLSRPDPPRDLLTLLSYRRVSLTIFVSEANARHALERARYLHSRPWRVIVEGVNTNVFQPDAGAGVGFRSAYGIGERPLVLAVGSLTLEKRYEFLFHVWSSLGPNAPDLVVCGEGVERDRLQASARALRLPVRFLGHLTPSALVGAYNAADCFVHGGVVETFGLSVLEAMACGRAVLAARAGAVPEVLGDTGVLAPPDEPDAFAAQLRDLLAAPSRRAALGAAARRRAMEYFSFPVMCRRYVSAIESVCR
jgi:glycosyltransferase involved in cell wall biosynthesis